MADVIVCTEDISSTESRNSVIISKQGVRVLNVKLCHEKMNNTLLKSLFAMQSIKRKLIKGLIGWVDRFHRFKGI